MSEYGSRDPQRFLDGWLDRLLWQLGIVRRGQYVKLATAYDDVFGWWSTMVKAELEAKAADEELVEVVEDDLHVAYVVRKSDREAFTKLIRGDIPKADEEK